MHNGFHSTYLHLDRGIFETLGAFGISNVLYGSGLRVFQTFHTGLLYHYSFIILFALFSIVFVYSSFLFLAKNLMVLVFVLVFFLSLI